MSNVKMSEDSKKRITTAVDDLKKMIKQGKNVDVNFGCYDQRNVAADMSKPVVTYFDNDTSTMTRAWFDANILSTGLCSARLNAIEILRIGKDNQLESYRAVSSVERSRPSYDEIGDIEEVWSKKSGYEVKSTVKYEGKTGDYLGKYVSLPIVELLANVAKYEVVSKTMKEKLNTSKRQ